AVAGVRVVASLVTELDAVATLTGAGRRRRATRLFFAANRAAIAEVVIAVVTRLAAFDAAVAAVGWRTQHAGRRAQVIGLERAGVGAAIASRGVAVVTQLGTCEHAVATSCGATHRPRNWTDVASLHRAGVAAAVAGCRVAVVALLTFDLQRAVAAH